MSYPATGTLTRTATITMVDVRHVLWRVESDLRVLRAQHGLITVEREQEIANDLLLFIYRNYIEQIEFRFVDPVTNTRKFAVRYALTRSWSGNDDDDAGGLRYRDLAGTSFTVIISYSTAWNALWCAASSAFGFFRFFFLSVDAP